MSVSASLISWFPARADDKKYYNGKCETTNQCGNPTNPAPCDKYVAPPPCTAGQEACPRSSASLFEGTIIPPTIRTSKECDYVKSTSSERASRRGPP